MHLNSLVALTGLVLLGTFAVARDPALDKAWRDWKQTYDKEYNMKGEEDRRREIWEDNLRMIEKHNREASEGKHTYRMGMNQFSDLMQEEFEETYTGCTSELPREPEGNETFFEASDNLRIPHFIDWRTKGYVTRVRNQGSCKSCWAFSAAGALEALNVRMTRKLVSLSPQNLVDCSWRQGNIGCRGGLPNDAFRYVQQNRGIASWAAYPYTGRVGKCRYRTSYRAATCNGYRLIQRNERALQQAVARIGPVSVGVNAAYIKHYHSGIFNSYCGRELNHSMLVVGYGSQNGIPYWIIKNSWGNTWGESGYMRLFRGKNLCGIAMQASYPI